MALLAQAAESVMSDGAATATAKTRTRVLSLLYEARQLEEYLNV